ncbi:MULTISPECIES: hypothetical protein [Streptomyces]|uniref:hypothetical protein n=1 Tax=Streptomyces TaxID=1883 RepID=UPI001F4F856B|nr:MULTISPECIES: hypothetical protein [Streptomyces]
MAEQNESPFDRPGRLEALRRRLLGERTQTDLIPVDLTGRISAGDEAGKFVRVEEFSGPAPSYLILLAHDQEFTHGCGDYWVEDFPALERFFAEGAWVVDWFG